MFGTLTHTSLELNQMCTNRKLETYCTCANWSNQVLIFRRIVPTGRYLNDLKCSERERESSMTLRYDFQV